MGRELTGEEKQAIIDSQLKSKQDRMASEARREGRNLDNPNRGDQNDNEDSSEGASSDWDDWQDADYIEE